MPLHIEVREKIRTLLEKGELVNDEGMLLTEAELVKRFGVSRVTIRNALQPLVYEGLIVRTAGKGTYVTNHGSESWIGRLQGLTEHLEETGHKAGAKTLYSGVVKSKQEISQHLGSKVVWQLKRLRFADDVPIAVEDSYCPPEIGLDLEKYHLDSLAVYKVLETDFKIEIISAEQSITAIHADKDIAEMLKLKKNDPILAFTRVTFTKNKTPVEYLRALYRPDYYQFQVSLTRRMI